MLTLRVNFRSRVLCEWGPERNASALWPALLTRRTVRRRELGAGDAQVVSVQLLHQRLAVPVLGVPDAQVAVSAAAHDVSAIW